MGVMGIEDEVGPPYATKKPAVPCRFIAILAGKGGFAGQPDATKDGSDARKPRNAIAVLT
jgi:hypothetical protein